MSFKENTYQQLSLTDSFSVLTPREQKALEKSWAKVFADEIFPAIDENRFSVLYSDKASGPNTPFADGCAGRKDCYGGRWCIQRLRCPAGHKPRSCSFMKHSKTMPDSGTEWKRFRRMSAKTTIWRSFRKTRRPGENRPATIRGKDFPCGRVTSDRNMPYLCSRWTPPRKAPGRPAVPWRRPQTPTS